MTERILSVDPGLANVGFAIMGPDKLLGYGLITTSPEFTIVDRVRKIHKKLCRVYRKYKCSMVLMEDFHGAMAMQNKKAAMDVAKAHGALYTLPGRIVFIAPVTVERNKERNREKKKAETVKRVNRRYAIALPFSKHHIADAITQGEYFYEKAR